MNASGAQFDLGKKDYYKGVKILIVLCWDYTCSVNENKFVSEDTLINGVKNGISVIKALKYFGIETKIVKNYRSAINEMCSGSYSQVWIVCGRMDGVMPGNNDSKTNEASLIDQFIECSILYWSKGGGLTFWTDNYPLTAEVNKFLEKAKFKYKDPSSSQVKERTVNFHLGGVYPGGKYLNRTNYLSICSFEGSNISKADGYEKELFNHELNTIFEGITISSAINGREKLSEWKDYKNMKFQLATENDIFPFKPFSRSSDNGFSSLYYIAPLNCDSGDIVIDCGFSKLFFELTKEGIDRYVKNIAVWMLQLEKKHMEEVQIVQKFGFLVMIVFLIKLTGKKIQLKLSFIFVMLKDMEQVSLLIHASLNFIIKFHGLVIKKILNRMNKYMKVFKMNKISYLKI